MDQKTTLKILNYLLSSPVKDSGYSDRFLKKFPDLSADIINSALADLKNEGAVVLTLGGGDIVFATITPRARGYIREIEEAATIKKAEKWDDRKWGIKMAVAGYVAGFISGVASLWVKSTFFP